MERPYDNNARKALRSMTKANAGVFLAIGALLAVTVNVNRAIKKLEELLSLEVLEETTEEEPDAKMARIIQEYSERVN